MLDKLVKKNPNENKQEDTLACYLIKLARLGGYLARKADPPPGNKVIWRGVTRLADIVIGYSLAGKISYG